MKLIKLAFERIDQYKILIEVTLEAKKDLWNVKNLFLFSIKMNVKYRNWIHELIHTIMYVIQVISALCFYFDPIKP